MNIEDITEEIIRETEYIEAITENGYPQYTEKEAITAAEALEDTQELEALQQLRAGEGLQDVYYTGLGEDLDRWEEAQLIERPTTGEQYVRLTRLSRTYLQYHKRKF